MQSKTPLLMVTALVCGLGAAFGTWKLVSGQKENVVDDQKVQVLVPVADVPAYHMFKDKQRFTMMEWPKSRLREDEKETVTDFEQIKDKTSRHYKLRANEPIYKNDICESMQNDISERLQSGEVAHAIPADANRGGGGFIKVGDRVNIAATVEQTSTEARKTFYLLEDIEVLAVDNQGQRDTTNIAAPPTRFLLRLTSQQSLVCKYFQDTARLDVDMRKQGDKLKLGSEFIFTLNKSTAAVKQYDEEIPPSTNTTALETSKIVDPDDNTPPAKTTVAATKTPGDLSDLTEEQIRNMQHKVKIDDGTKREVVTNETYRERELVKKEKDKSKEEPKKEETKKD